MKQPKDFRYLRGLLYDLSKPLKLDALYIRAWNIINYMIVGGIGVGINYLVFFLLIAYLPWFIVNILAIFTAFIWNWANSVGPMGWAWGFREKGGTNNKQKKKSRN